MAPSRAARLLSLSPLRAILTLAIPSTAVMVLGATSGIANTYFVSRLGADSIAAVSLVFPIALILMTMMGGGIGAGVSAAIAQALGAGRPADADSVAEHAFLITFAIALILTAGLVGGAPTVFRWMGGRGDVLTAATLFARVLFGGSLITFTVSAFDSILRGEGNVRVPSIWATVSLTTQIVLTPIFMFPLGMGLPGAAVATLTGQLVGSLPRAHYIFSGSGLVRPRLVPAQVHMRPIADILRIGIPASLATLTNYLGLVLVTAIVARYGTSEIAAFGLGTRLDFFIITLAFGVGSAVLTVVGLASGAGDRQRVSALLARAVELVSVMLVIVAVILVWRPGIWLDLFTTDPEILAVGAHYLRTLAPSYPLLGISMVCSFTFQGLGRAMFPLIVVSSRTLIVVAGAGLAAWMGSPVRTIFLIMAAGNATSSLLLWWRLRAMLGAAGKGDIPHFLPDEEGTPLQTGG